MNPSEPQNNKADEIEENIRVTIELANNLHKSVRIPEFAKLSADERHQFMIEKYKTFADNYPVVLRLLARDMKYNPKAFRKMLNKIKESASQPKTPSKPGANSQMEGMYRFIEHQANYAKFLYIEESKVNGKHVNPKKANEIWKIEYDSMASTLKSIVDKEKKARNKYEEEKKKNLESKRKELLEFVISQPDEGNASKVETDNDEIDKVEIRENNQTENIRIYKENLDAFFKEAGKPEVMASITNQELKVYTQNLNECETILPETENDKIVFCRDAIKKETERREKLLQEEWIPQHILRKKKNKHIRKK